MTNFIADIAKCMSNGMVVTQNEEDISYILEETTPIKACGDLAYEFDNSCETLFLLIRVFFLQMANIVFSTKCLLISDF